MDDARVWSFEEGLWTGDADHYRTLVDAECLMVLPTPPYVFSGEQAIAAVSDTPRWTTVDLSERRIARPQGGLIVVAYEVTAERDGVPSYQARCTSTYRRIAHDEWRVIQHQQTPPLTAAS
jgi:ketosteroid isomerase-like protein